MPHKPLTHAERMKALRAPMPEDRGTAHQRGYGAEWRKLRRMQLNRHPICQSPGCTDAATDVDHIIARAKGGLDTMDNLQSLCHSHHSQKTVREDGGFKR